LTLAKQDCALQRERFKNALLPPDKECVTNGVPVLHNGVPIWHKVGIGLAAHISDYIQ
jgi:hypothetical protein